MINHIWEVVERKNDDPKSDVVVVMAGDTEFLSQSIRELLEELLKVAREERTINPLDFTYIITAVDRP